MFVINPVHVYAVKWESEVDWMNNPLPDVAESEQEEKVKEEKAREEELNVPVK